MTETNEEALQRIATQASRSPLTAPEPSASVGMEPIKCSVWNGKLFASYGPIKLPNGDYDFYTADQLTTLQAKLEQVEKDRAELVEVMRRVVYLSDRDHDAWNVAKELIAKYEVKKS